MVDELDYEQKKQYELTVRATDSVSGVYAEVLVSILVLDVNDCPPEFTQDSYNISVSEAASFGTSVLRVSSRDNDTGKLVVSFKLRVEISNYRFSKSIDKATVLQKISFTLRYTVKEKEIKYRRNMHIPYLTFHDSTLFHRYKSKGPLRYTKRHGEQHGTLSHRSGRGCDISQTIVRPRDA